jgi:predicted Zn-dependent protease
MSRIGFVMLLSWVAVAGVGCVSDRQVISQAADVHKGLQPAVVTDAELAGYIQRVGGRVVDEARKLDGTRDRDQDNSWMFNDMQFHLVNSKTLNAFTTGGKHMYIYTELMQLCKNEDELAAVMAHEYAHVYRRHVAKGMNRQYAILGLAAGAGAAGYALSDENRLQTAGIAGGAALLAGQFVGMGFTRDDEDEADKFGFQLYCRAGWDPNKFSGFFQTLIDKGMDKTPEAMSDHPKLSTRVANTRERASRLPPEASSWRSAPVADAAKFRDLQARATRVGRTMPNDKSLQKAQLMLAAFPSCVTSEEQPEQKQAQATIYHAMQENQKRRQQ